MRAAFESAGDIRSVDLLSALVALWRDKADGSLNFSRPGATAGFELRGGELVRSTSSQTHYEAVAILLRAGKLEAAAVAKLKRQSISYELRKLPSYGTWQLFFFDPNGAKVEIDFDAAEPAPS